MPIYFPTLTSIDIAETRRYAGLAKKPDFQTTMLEAICFEAQLLATPRASWSIYPYDSCRGLILSQPKLELTGKSIKKHLTAAVDIAVLSVTVGEKIEQTVTDYFGQGRYTEALLLDAAATTAVEMAADQINSIIVQEAQKNGLTAISRFSPGYDDWNITVQPTILQLSQGETIGITTTSSCMLIPRKSITAVIGLLPTDVKPNPPEHNNHNCQSCSQDDCSFRKESIND
ncbi:MAG: methionine synthase [Veillonellaceae bacterium]|nr:methionine synthase [Veillonellaceae bacterium]